MKITIVGAGNGGSAIAADLTLKGHEVTLLKTSNGIHNEHFNTILNNGYKISLIRNGVKKVASLKLITTDYEMALQGSELVIVFIQTNYHEEVAKKIAPYLRDQIVMLQPGYLGTLYFKKYNSLETITYVEAESSPIDCRITNPGEVTVLFENVVNPIGVYPVSRSEGTLTKLATLGYNFESVNSIIESALHNPNLIVHTLGAIMSMPRIEYTKGEYWMYREVFTPSVWSLVEGLDNEKMEVLDRLNLPRLSYVEACKKRNSSNSNEDAREVFFYYANNHSPKGPNEVDSRYITEDVPEGLVLLESLGEYFNVPTPICSSLINIASGALKRDFRANGRSIKRLGESEFRELMNSCIEYA
ncbi:NAD/NADP octopine/nopaline dehydrogenase family protein [Bacillus pacificus]|uniref:NAD/NADP octopine/nopaline dehydrogenase family protein n=1 Tax=Bacillus pacificus TaxID=2026187 RepID=UPI003D657D54